jgi:hypothetical protein
MGLCFEGGIDNPRFQQARTAMSPNGIRRRIGFNKLWLGCIVFHTGFFATKEP